MRFKFMANNTNEVKAEYFLDKKSHGVLGVTLSLTATIFGASAVLGLMDEAAIKGLPATWLLLSGSFGFACLLFLLKKIDITNFHSISEYFGSIFGEGYRKLSALLIALSWTAIIAAQLVAMGKVFSVILDLEFIYGVVLTASIIFFYTAAAGQRGVISTDKIQSIGIAAGLIYLCSLINPVVLKSAFNNPTTKDLFGFPVNSGFNYANLITMLIAAGVPYIIGPDIYSRMLVAKNKVVVYKSIVISIFIITIIAFIIAIIGINFKLTMAGVKKDYIFFFFKSQPAVLKILFAVFVFCVIGSSADTCLMTASTLSINDVFKVSSSGKRLVCFTRIAMLFIIITASVIAVRKPVIIKNLLLAYKIFSISFLTPFVYNMIFDLKKNRINAGVLFILNIAVLLVFFVLEYQSNKYSFIYSIVYYFILFYFCLILPRKTNAIP